MNVFIEMQDDNKKQELPNMKGVKLNGFGKPLIHGEQYDGLIYRLTNYSLYQNLPTNVVQEMAIIIENTEDDFHPDMPKLKKLFRVLKATGASLTH